MSELSDAPIVDPPNDTPTGPSAVSQQPPPPPTAAPARVQESGGTTIDTVERSQLDINTAKANGVVESNVWPGINIETGERTDGSEEPNTEESK